MAGTEDRAERNGGLGGGEAETEGSWWTRRTWRRGVVRVVAVVGVVLLVAGVSGWWLTTRVLDDDGFAEVVTDSLQRQEVRSYVAEEITLQLAASTKLITAARPVADSVIAEVLRNPVVVDFVHDVVAGVHHQVFEFRSETRASVSATSAAATVKAAIQAIDDKIAERIPSQLYTLGTGLTHNRPISLAARLSPWVRTLYVPALLLGLAALVLVVVKSRDGVHAVRFVGFALAVAGAFVSGCAAVSPFVGALADDDATRRASAVGAFVDVLVEQLVRAGLLMAVVGLLLAFVPGRDGSGALTRGRRLIRRTREAASTRRGQLAVGVSLVAIAWALLTQTSGAFAMTLIVASTTLAFSGLLTMVRAAGALPAGPQVFRRLRARQVVGVATTMVLCSTVVGVVAGALIAAPQHADRADPGDDGCNGSIELCFQPIDRIMWPASHNAMSSVVYDSFAAEHTISIPEQLDRGARALLLDAYYGYTQSGIVRTNIAGGASRQEILDKFGPDAVDELDRLGALTGALDTSGTKKDVYLCHEFCELGAVRADTVFSQIDQFLGRHPTDVVVLDVEDYVQPADLRRALEAAGLWDRVYTLDPSQPMPTLLDLVTPTDGEREAPRRLIVMAERHGGTEPWLADTYKLSQETPYTFKSVADFNCAPNRGDASNPLFLLNHWLRQPGPPDPVAAAKTNSTSILGDRIEQCIAARRKLPNFVAIDFFGVGDATELIDQYNAAIASQTGVAAALDQLVDEVDRDPDTSTADQAELDALQRLPTMTQADASALLGPLSGTFPAPGELPNILNPAAPASAPARG